MEMNDLVRACIVCIMLFDGNFEEQHFLKGSNDKSFWGRMLSLRLPWWPLESRQNLHRQG